MKPEENLRFVQLAQRTMVNYGILVETAEKTGRTIYQVTHLMTGLVGIFVWTKEAFFEWDQINKEYYVKWDALKTELNRRKIPKDIKQTTGQLQSYIKFFSYLRHGIAHGNFKFGADALIEEVTIWNCLPSTPKEKNWQAEIKIATLQQLARWTVHDLNAASFATFNNNGIEQPTDIKVYPCSCGFLWIGEDKPVKCVSCCKSEKWELSCGGLSIEKIKKWDGK